MTATPPLLPNTLPTPVATLLVRTCGGEAGGESATQGGEKRAGGWGVTKGGVGVSEQGKARLQPQATRTRNVHGLLRKHLCTPAVLAPVAPFMWL